jgi:hypothetical protein
MPNCTYAADTTSIEELPPNHLSTRVSAFLEREAPPLPSEIEALCTLYDAFSAAQGAFLAFMNQPRCGTGSAFDLLDEYCDLMALRRDRVVQKLKEIEPVDERERELKAEAIITHDFGCGEELPIIVANLARLAIPSRKIEETD